MKIICVDDETLVLDLTAALCRELPQKPEVRAFDNAADALKYSEDNKADIAILDINMPDMDGLMLAAKLKELHPDTAIIFLTGHPTYAVDAYKLHASGYLLKPLNKERLESEVEYAMSIHPPRNQSHIEVHTFGKFDVFVDGSPIMFARSKAKELLAYLVDRQGQVSRADAFSALWEDGVYDRAMQKQLDVVIRSLRDTLEEYGASEIVEMKRGVLRVVPEKFDCDLYSFLDGDMDAIQAYRGEFMSDYSWANITEAYMDKINR